MTWKRVRQDAQPTQRKAKSTLATATLTDGGAITKATTVGKIEAEVKKVIKAKSQQGKYMIAKTVERAKQIGRGIDQAAEWVGKAGVVTEAGGVLAIGAGVGLENPALIAAGRNMMIAGQTGQQFELAYNKRTSDFKLATDREGKPIPLQVPPTKYQKAIRTVDASQLPRVDMMYAPYPPMTTAQLRTMQSTHMGDAEMVD